MAESTCPPPRCIDCQSPGFDMYENGVNGRCFECTKKYVRTAVRTGEQQHERICIKCNQPSSTWALDGTCWKCITIAAHQCRQCKELHVYLTESGLCKFCRPADDSDDEKSISLSQSDDDDKDYDDDEASQVAAIEQDEKANESSFIDNDDEEEGQEQLRQYWASQSAVAQGETISALGYSYRTNTDISRPTDEQVQQYRS